MQYSQMALSTVSHNVVNANTAGYSRQIIQSSAASTGGIGAGVQMDQVQRITDRFLSSRVLTATSSATFTSTKAGYLSSLEDTFTTANANGGLENVVGVFVTSLNSLASDPANSSLRRNVVQQAELVAGALNNVNADLKTVAVDADNSITAELNSVNQLLKDIYQLNNQILQLTASGKGGGTDLMDTRDSKIQQLSQSLGVQVTYNTSTGGVRVTTENGRRLVDENSYVQLSRGTMVGDYQNIVMQSVQIDGSLSPAKLPLDPADMTTGKVKALIDVRDTTVPALLSQVDNFTQTFTAAVNRLTSQGTSYPPVGTLSGGNDLKVALQTTDLLANGYSTLGGASINISVTNSLGNVISTTAGGTAIVLDPANMVPPAPGQTTLSLADIANIINNNPTIGNTALGGTPTSGGVIATVETDSLGRHYLQVTSADASNKVVMSNVTGDVLGTLGMNNLFTNTSSSSLVGVRSDISNNPDLFPVARMRADGGVSNTDGQNIIALAGLSDTKIKFAAAGGLGFQETTAVGYLNTLASTLAVNVSAAKDNATFAASLQGQAQELATSISGVNINEELAQMLVYQNSFQASARIISVVNDLLQELVNIM